MTSAGPSILSRLGHSRAQAVAAYRRRDRKALAALVASKLLAYRASTIYGRSVASLRALIEGEVLPTIFEESDARVVKVEAWPEGGPTVAALVQAIHEQLELGPAGASLAPPQALEEAIERARRRSERPIVFVLYGVERIDAGRDPIEERRFIDALARLVTTPIRGLSLLMVVEEAHLGIFRELLRGRWRLLVHDVRIPEGEGLGLAPLPLLTGGSTIASAAAGAGAGAAAAGAGAAATTALTAGSRGLAAALAGALGILGLGVGVSGHLRARAAEAELAACQEALAAAEARECPAPAGGPGRPSEGAAPPDSPSAPTAPRPPIEGAPTLGTGEPGGDPTTTAADVEAPQATTSPSTGEDAIATAPEAPRGPARAVGLCDARAGDNPCAACVRASCCAELQACKSRKWQRCVLSGTVGDGECTPAAIAKGCRALALCALEYTCHAACYAP